VPTDMKIDYVELPAADIPAVRSFYEAAFDWKFMDYGPEYSSFEDGKMTGGFYKAEMRSRTENGAALIVIYASNLEQVHESVLSNGGEIIKDIFSFPGGRRFQFADPNGNELAVWSDK
jgi:uncharacterized protein